MDANLKTRNKFAVLSNLKPSYVFLALSILVGGYIRLSEVISSSFPLNDGGLFYTMTTDIVANNFGLPLVTSYNHLDIPFAYPPLAFYFTGFLNQIFGWSLLDVYRILPAIAAILMIPAFFVFAKNLISDEFQLGVATLIFSLIPVTFVWTIMGGGVARSIGFLFSLVSLNFLYRVYTQKKRIDIFACVFFLSLTILTHPETGFHSVLSIPVFWFFFGRNRVGTIKSLVIGLAVVLSTAPWWGNILVNHGFEPFKSALLTAGQDGNAFFDFVLFQLTNEIGLGSIAVLGLFGFFICMSQRQYFLPVWVLFSYFSGPRSALIFIAPCIAILASIALMRILKIVDHVEKRDVDLNANKLPLYSIAGKVLFGLLFLQWFASSMNAIVPFAYTRVTPADQQAFDWVSKQTTSDSRFLVLTKYVWSADPVSEWFPALTGRTSVATVQGTEWLKDSKFKFVVERNDALQKCTDQSISCLDAWSKEYKMEYNYIYLRKLTANEKKELIPYDNALAVLLKNDPNYELVYDTEQVSIFKKW
jgi:hypothetical protein